LFTLGINNLEGFKKLRYGMQLLLLVVVAVVVVVVLVVVFEQS